MLLHQVKNVSHTADHSSICCLLFCSPSLFLLQLFVIEEEELQLVFLLLVTKRDLKSVLLELLYLLFIYISNHI